jgi:ABC-type multidrug transport system fused ATPase/permease subunit
MKLWPTKERHFHFADSKAHTLERLKRRTEYSEWLTSNHTEKSFRGVIEDNHFKLITSEIGFGAFCVMEGTINETTGTIKVTIHNVFKGFLSLFMLFPIAGFIMVTFFDKQEFSWIMLLVVLLQIVIIRFAIIELVFRRLSKRSLKSLRDVLDVEWGLT